MKNGSTVEASKAVTPASVAPLMKVDVSVLVVSILFASAASASGATVVPFAVEFAAESAEQSNRTELKLGSSAASNVALSLPASCQRKHSAS